MIPRPTVPDTRQSPSVTGAALQAYAAICPSFANTTMTYDAARAHGSGDGLADFLVIELTEGGNGGSPAARFERAAQQVEYAIASLDHVAAQLRGRALTASSLPLPLFDARAPEPALAAAGAADAW